MGTPSTKLTTLEQLQMQAVRIKAELEKYVKASDAATDEEVEELLNEVFSEEENATE